MTNAEGTSPSSEGRLTEAQERPISDERPMSYQDLIREIRRPGKVLLPVLTRGDVEHLVAEKSDLLAMLAEGSPSEKAPWFVVRRDGGFLRLDVQD